MISIVTPAYNSEKYIEKCVFTVGSLRFPRGSAGAYYASTLH